MSIVLIEAPIAPAMPRAHPVSAAAVNMTHLPGHGRPRPSPRHAHSNRPLPTGDNGLVTCFAITARWASAFASQLSG